VFLKASILEAHGIEFAPFRTERSPEQDEFRANQRFGGGKTLVLLLALNAGEEVALGLFRHRNVSETIAHLGGGTLHQLIATSIIIFLILIPFFAFRAKQG
jgi:hypothetical protein